MFNYRLSTLRYQNRDHFQKQASDKAESERDPLKNMQSSSFLHSSYNTHSGYSFFNQLNQISSTQAGRTRPRNDKQQMLLGQRMHLKETQAKILDYHVDQIAQRAKDHQEVIKKMSENRNSLLEAKQRFSAQSEENKRNFESTL